MHELSLYIAHNQLLTSLLLLLGVFLAITCWVLLAAVYVSIPKRRPVIPSGE